MHANPSIAIACMPLLRSDECDAILAELETAAWRDATIATPADPQGVAAEIRRCSIFEIVDPSLLARLQAFIEYVNASLFKFEIERFRDDDPVAAMRYGEGGHFDWHLDNATSGTYATRKLSFTIQLTDPSEYDGGTLELGMYSRDFGGTAGYAGYTSQIRQRGAITVFPAFHLHRVSAVTRGIRTAIVGWMHGPAFK